MNKESYSCKACFLKKRCPSPLQPERIRSTGYISKGTLAPVQKACRHTTCNEGFEAARKAIVPAVRRKRHERNRGRNICHRALHLGSLINLRTKIDFE